MGTQTQVTLGGGGGRGRFGGGGVEGWMSVLEVISDLLL